MEDVDDQANGPLDKPDEAPTTSAGKRRRSTDEEMSIKLSADLDKMKSLDTNGWAAKKKEKHQEDLEKLTSRVEKLAAKEAKKQRQMQRSISSARSEESTAKTQRAPPMSEEGMKRLIYARMMMDPEFEKAINSSNSKWEMVANKFNKGFIAGKAKLYGVDQDVVFDPLPESEHAEPVTLQKKWDKMSADYRQILMKKQGVDAEVSLRTHSHGAKRPEGEIMSESNRPLGRRQKFFTHAESVGEETAWNGGQQSFLERLCIRTEINAY